MGHEYQHGVTRYTQNLFSKGQPGALDESLSDIFGEFIAHDTPSVGSQCIFGKSPHNNLPLTAVMSGRLKKLPSDYLP